MIIAAIVGAVGDEHTRRTPAPYVAAAILIIALLLEAWTRRTPSPEPLSAPPDTFSATRAMAMLERVLGDEAPHPVGSTANGRVRARILDELRMLALEPELDASWVCRGIVCAPVVNVIARIPGRTEGPAVLLVSHYDSVHAGPGAGDDTHGVAVLLEVARALRAGARPERPVVLLFDEGEEVGLLGAELFTRDPQRLAEIGVAINVEARGTEGRTAMFESSEGNAELVERYAGSVTSPEASSLSVEVYRRMPNDTDLTVLMGAGLPGINLAFIGGVARYHTPLDDLAHLDRGSVQHQGDTVLAATRAFASGEPPQRGDDAAFADVLGMALVRWPAQWSLPIIGLCALALLAAAVLAIRGGLVRTGALVLGALGCVLVWSGAALAAFALVEAIAAKGGGAPAAYAHPLPLRIAVWATLGAATIGLAALVGRRVRPAELALATWIVWALLAAFVVALAPGVAPVFVLPLVPTALAFVVAAKQGRRDALAQLVPAMGLALFAGLWGALVSGLEEAFGWALPLALTVPAAAITSHAAWACVNDEDTHARRNVLVGCAAIALAAGIAALVVDRYDRDAPRQLTVVQLTDADSGEAVLTLAPGVALPEPLQGAAAFAPAPQQSLPWSRAGVWTAPSQAHDRAPPWLDRLPSSDERVRVRLVAPWADRIMLLFDEGERVAELTVAGEQAAAPEGSGPHRVHLFGFPPDGVELGLLRTGDAPLPVRIVACGPALPDDAAALARVRDTVAVPVQWGDAACVVATETF